MRLTLNLLGLELDISLGPAGVDEGCSLDGGTTASYPIGFSDWPVPEDIQLPQRTPAWDDEE